jgi:predicted 2-oxoglutarate/Fe(II)-dependent dioxygenase YbiX
MLSMSVQLTNDHEGGQFVIYKPGTEEPKYPKLGVGDALLFKSTLQHEVQPITKGERYALVLWFMTKE